MGTPTTLEQALEPALLQTPMNKIMPTARANLRDFLAQKFGAAYMKAESQGEVQRLEELWNSILTKGE